MSEDMVPLDPDVSVQKLLADLAPEVYKDAAQPLMRKIGRAFELLFDRGILFRLQRWHFRGLLQRNLGFIEDIKTIPDDQVCPIPPQIGIPILERLSYCDEDIAKLFSHLLVTSASDERNNLAHPRFVQIIDSLSSDEARILAHLEDKGQIHYLGIGEDTGCGEVDIISPKLTVLETCIEFQFPDNVTLYLDNLSSLGILNGGLFAYYQPSIHETYDSLCSLHKQTITDMKAGHYGNDQVRILQGSYDLTELGRMFIEACTRQDKLSSDD